MRFFALLLVGYLPGWATLWLAGGGGAAGTAPFLAVVASAALASWVGFTLAEREWFSLGALSGVLGTYTLVVGGLAVRRGHPRPRVLGTPSLVPLAVGALVAVLYWPPFDTSVLASDASFHRAAGMHLAKHGSLAIDDPLLAALTRQQRSVLFEPAAFGGFARIPGGILLPDLDATRAYPSFAHLLPVWIALAYGLGGVRAVGAVGPAFAALALWAIWLVVRERRGAGPATLAVLLVATNLGQWYFARLLMPEVLAEAFLWGGIVAYAWWWQTGGAVAAAVAGLALGSAGLARTELLLLLPLAIGLTLAWPAHRPRGSGVFVAVFAAMVAHGVAHLALVPAHYRDVLAAQVAAFSGRSWAIGGMLLTLTGGVVAVTARRQGALAARRIAVVCVAVGAAVAYGMRSTVAVPATLVWLAESSSWLTLALAGFGACTMRVAPPVAAVVFAVAGLPFVWDPHVTPTMLWGIRRFVPVVIPCLGMFAAAAVAWVGRRSRPAAIALAVLLIVANAWPMGRLILLPLYPSPAAAIAELAATLPADAVVIVAPELTAYLIHLPLWMEHDRTTIVAPADPRWPAKLALTAAAIAARHPIVFLGHGFGSAPAIVGFTLRERTRTELRTLIPAIDPVRAPAKAALHLVPLRAYDLVPNAGR